MEAPRIWYERTVNYFKERIRKDPLFANYSGEQVHTRALGATYNNWVLRFKRRDGIARDGINDKQIKDTEELINSLGIDQNALFDVLDKLYAHTSMSNPAMKELDRLTRDLLFAMVERKGYAPHQLVA